MTGRPTRAGQRLVLVPEARQHDTEPTPFLRRLTEADCERFLDAAQRHTYRSRETVISQGTHPDVLLLVLDGHLQESHNTTDGQEVILDIHGPGDIVGAVDVVDGRPAMATVRASRRAEALVVSGTNLRALLMDAPSLTVAILRGLAGRVRDAEQARVHSATLEVLPRITRRLVDMAERWGERCDDGVSITLHLSQAELASWAGVSREAAVKALRVLREEGLVDTGRRQLTVTDLERLRQHPVA